MLIANEQLEPSDNEQPSSSEDISEQRKITNGGDEELTPLHWLHDKNLLKGLRLFLFLCVSVFDLVGFCFTLQASIYRVPKCNHLLM